MAKTIRELLDSVPEAVLRRGEDIYRGEGILSLSRSTAGLCTGRVSGSSGGTYAVRVQVSEAGEVSEHSCTCPYEDGEVCKHLAAVLMAIGEGDVPDGNPAKPASAPARDLPALLEALPREKLLAIILSQAEADERFKAGLLLDVSPPDVRSDMAIVREIVRRSIRINTRKGFIDDQGCDAICLDLGDCLERAQDRLARGEILCAFEITLYVFMTGADLASDSDSSSGDLGGVMEDGFGQLEEICLQAAKRGDAAVRRACYEKLCKEALDKALDGWSFWSYGLLRIATLLLTQRNRDRLAASLATLQERGQEQGHAAYEQTQGDQVRLRMIQMLDGEDAARAFIDTRLEVDEFRVMAVEDDLRKGDLAHAERLCLERVQCPVHGGWARNQAWWHRLYGIQERMQDRRKMLSTAKSILLQGDLTYYETIKALLQEEGTWEERYPALRAELKTALSGFQYAQILDQEDERALLLEEVKRNSRLVFRYGKKLAKEYPQAVFWLYRLEITKAAREATHRSEYVQLCGLLEELDQAGGKDDALALADAFTQEYRRRPALLEELARLKRKLSTPARRQDS